MTFSEKKKLTTCFHSLEYKKKGKIFQEDLYIYIFFFLEKVLFAKIIMNYIYKLRMSHLRNV